MELVTCDGSSFQEVATARLGAARRASGSQESVEKISRVAKRVMSDQEDVKKAREYKTFRTAPSGREGSEWPGGPRVVRNLSSQESV